MRNVICQSTSSHSQVALKSSTVIRNITISVEIGISTFKIKFPLYLSAEYYHFGIIVKPNKFHVDLYRVFDVSEHVFIQPDEFERDSCAHFHCIGFHAKMCTFLIGKGSFNVQTPFCSSAE